MTLVRFLDTDPQVISAETTLRAKPEEVYALVANPARHAELDGGGNVVRLRQGEEKLLKVGDSFTQNMKLGVPYRMTSTVVRAEENRAITWQLPAGHTWGFEIFDRGDGTVTVRETFDASGAKLASLPMTPALKAAGAFARNRKNIALTLANLHRIFA